jgi:hypothetical protein
MGRMKERWEELPDDDDWQFEYEQWLDSLKDTKEYENEIPSESERL